MHWPLLILFALEAAPVADVFRKSPEAIFEDVTIAVLGWIVGVLVAILESNDSGESVFVGCIGSLSKDEVYMCF